ncbi:MAG: (Fe-S)-binding protein [Chrysiogenales bacterium]
MSQPATAKNPLTEKINQLSPADLQKAVQVFREQLHAAETAYLNSCVHCGLCAESCHFYLSSGEIQALPAYKLNLVTSVFKKYFSFMGRNASFLNGARELEAGMVGEWLDSLFGRCSLCGRCALNCTIGINVTHLIRCARAALTAIGVVPAGLQSTITAAVATGNNMGISREDWLETVQWLSEELQREVQDANASLPLDVKGANVLYALNPREVKFFPLSLLATAKIFYAAGESWTFSSDFYDVTNYGLYSGDDATAGLISGRLVDEMERLGAKILVLGECGHGFNANRWEAPEWLQKKYSFEVLSILQLIKKYILQNKISLDPALNLIPVTLHDPCNLVRLGGICEEQRFILKRAVSDFKEMTPNREKNYCCSGGGGQLAMTEFAARRLQAGGLKAKQITASGAKIVVAPCHNCIDQLSELNREYKLGVEVKTVSETVANALVLKKENREKL